MNRNLFLRERPAWKVRQNAACALAVAFSLVLTGVVVGNNLRPTVGLSQ